MAERLLRTPSQHPFSLSGVLDSFWHQLCEITIKTTWAPLTRLAEGSVISMLQKFHEGELIVITRTSRLVFPQTHVAGNRSQLRSEIRVLDDTFWIRVCTMGDLGFAEAYMYGEIECDDLISTFLIFIRNQKHLEGVDSRLSHLLALPQRLASKRFVNSLGNSQSNISAHYDITNGLFSGFLSQDMTYSCAIFKSLDGDQNSPLLLEGETMEIQVKRNLECSLPSPITTPFNEVNDVQGPEDQTDELLEAQMRKLDHIIRQARIVNGQRILEIGSGWGSLAIRIVQRFPECTVDTITLSINQQSLAQTKISAAGVANRVKVHLMDYRLMPGNWKGIFDRVVSIEMIEAVGREFYEVYFRTIDWALKPDTGVGVVSSSTLPEARFESYTKKVDFIRKWIFPGGSLPTLTSLINGLTKGSSGRLVVDTVSNIGPHYPKTLKAWRRRFILNFEKCIKPALCSEHPGISSDEKRRYDIDVFKRKWIYYFCYCEAGFATRRLGDHIITFSREGDESFRCLN